MPNIPLLPIGTGFGITGSNTAAALTGRETAESDPSRPSTNTATQVDTSNIGAALRDSLLAIGVFVAFLVFGRTVIQELL